MTRDRRRGFTLIELLVAIGIILLLVSIAVIGYQKLDKVAGDNSTKTRLALCASVLSEYETTATLNPVEGPNGTYHVGDVTGAPSNVNLGGGDRYSGPVTNTAAIFQTLLQVPSIQSTVGQLGGNAMLTANTGTNGITTGWFDANGNALPVVVDAWKNPIIFVPSGGLWGVYVGKQSSTALQTNVPGGTKNLVKSADGRPFWASAGQDGNFQFGDDNLYSCAVTYTILPKPW